MSRRKWYMAGVLVVLSAFAVFGIAVLGLAQGAGTPLSVLLNGNDNFVAGAPEQKPVTAALLQKLAQGQHPSAVVVACSDSRVAPEIIFDRTLGDIFVVRTAGNVLDDVGMGSVEYAVEHLHTPLILVLGHTQCGAVMAALGVNEEGGDQPVHQPNDHIGAILSLLAPAVKAARAANAPTDAARLEIAIQANVRHVVHQLRIDPVFQAEVRADRLTIVGAEYSLDSGKVALLP